MSKKLEKAEAAICEKAASYPDAVKEHPWGDQVFKVKKKIFVFVGMHDGAFHFSAKLPESSEAALMFPFATPTAYGLGKAGWVSCKFAGKDEIPVALLLTWLDESYRAIAPKTQLKALLARQGGAVAKEAVTPPSRKAAPAKAAARQGSRRRS